MSRKLLASDLRWTLNPDAVDIKLGEGDRARPGALGQDRALRALDVGLGIRNRGFNLFVVGAPGTGRTSTIRAVLTERAAREPVPDDWCLLYNFDDSDRPKAVRMPPGTAVRLRRNLDTFVERLEATVHKAFEAEAYHRRREAVASEHEAKTNEALEDVETEARRRGFMLRRTTNGLTLGPTRDGEPLTEDEFNELPEEERSQLENESKHIEDMLDASVRVIRQLERETEERIDALDREVVANAVEPLLKELDEKFGLVEGLSEHFKKIREDLLDNLDAFKPVPDVVNEEGDSTPAVADVGLGMLDDDEPPPSVRYRANVLVDNGKLKGAPVIEETHPTPFNLLGRVEHRMRGGETLTDFTRIKAGALHHGNGGYLFVDAVELLRESGSWEGLKRALKHRKLEIEDPGEAGRMISIASLRPEPVPLEIKVVIIGTPDVYYLLSRTDPDFRKLFKIKVDFDTEAPRNDVNLEGYARFICAVAREEQLHPLEPGAVARTIEHAARLASRRDKLSTRFGEIADLLREADLYATRRAAAIISANDIRAALDARTEREAFLEFQLREEIERGIVRIDLEGGRIGQINGLTVVDLGSYAFGHPVRVTATTALGPGGIQDIERETELGGPIHTKGVLILSGHLRERFGQGRPLRFSANLCVEQSYMPIDGDSASLAEACALFSALAQIPIEQRFAVTGAIDQHGGVQAVGGTNDKLEGFFACCKQRGLDGHHAVIIPESNVEELMLREEIVEACRNGRFSVYAVSRIEQAMTLLTGVPFGEPGADGRYPEGTVGSAVQHTLETYDQAWRAQRGPRDAVG